LALKRGIWLTCCLVGQMYCNSCTFCGELQTEFFIKVLCPFVSAPQRTALPSTPLSFCTAARRVPIYDACPKTPLLVSRLNTRALRDKECREMEYLEMMKGLVLKHSFRTHAIETLAPWSCSHCPQMPSIPDCVCLFINADTWWPGKCSMSSLV
jgi:hypothetical protein